MEITIVRAEKSLKIYVTQISPLGKNEAWF